MSLCAVTPAVIFKGLDAPFLRLRQSDMCLVCIAFASWVLKTANPQVGDAWKAGTLEICDNYKVIHERMAFQRFFLLPILMIIFYRNSV